MKTRDDIFAAINTERARQVKKGWDDGVDDRNTLTEWRECILHQFDYLIIKEITFRNCMLRIAALCVAAIESDIRKNS